jgi:integrase
VRFSLKRRPRDPFHLVVFRGPDGRRKERSTGEGNLKRAKESAVAVIQGEYSPRAVTQAINWDDAIAMLGRAIRSANLRPNTLSSYEMALRTLRKVFPDAPGPGSITAEMARQYKNSRMEEVGAETIRGDLMELKTVFGKWWGEECGLLSSNPFADVVPPKVDEKEPRIITAAELDTLFRWIEGWWEGWRLPILFLEVKASVGCRIRELASMPTRNLVDGRLVFEAEVAKGRKTRQSKLPKALHDELLEAAGPIFLFERFPDQLRDLLLERGHPHHARCVRFPYDPERLVGWVQDRVVEFRKAHPEIPRFKLHNLRGTAMSRARQGGASYDEAAVAFGCNPETMRRHYEKLDEVAISDAVMDRVQGDR